MFAEVLDATSSQSLISKAASSSLDHTVGEHRVEFDDGVADWTSLSIPKVLAYMIAESPNFKSLINDLLQSSDFNGEIFSFVLCQAVTTAL